jgi:uncharacterized Zn-binding protein involved in type VI secretion
MQFRASQFRASQFRTSPRTIFMNIRTALRAVVAVAPALLLVGLCNATPRSDSSGQAVDSGSFAVMINGKRVATETFSIHQNSSGSVITSDFKADGTGDDAAQSSELQLTAAGELRKYTWKEIRPGKAQFTVYPTNDFLMERYSMNPQEKEVEQPFLLPNSTMMLDDYSFVQREILAWKYFAIGCHQDKGPVACPLHQKTMFGTLNPHARSSTPVSLEFAGREKVTIHGAEKELIRLNLKSDAGDWALWLDDQFKLQRILVPGESIEVMRD